MRIILLFFSLILYSCTSTEFQKEESSSFSFSQTSELFKVRTPYVFVEPFHRFDTLYFEGERICTLLTNGQIQSVKREEIAFEIFTHVIDTPLTHPETGLLQKVTVVEESFYTNGDLRAKTELYMQSRFDGFYILYYKNHKGELIVVPEDQQYCFPTEPISGYVTTPDGGQDKSLLRNNWKGMLYSPILFRYEWDLTGAYTMIEGAFALEALTQPAYVINGTGYPDGIDVKTYHQGIRDYSIDGKPYRTTTRFIETNYHFKFWGLREKQYAVFEDTQIGNKSVKSTRDHYLLQWVYKEYE